jgi:hypothetical protein
MTRQNALPTQFTELQQDASGMVQPVAVINLITAKQYKESRTKRDRTWEKSNPANSYRIPADLRIPAKDISASLVSIAAEYLTTISSVAAALMAFSLAHLRSGKLEIEARPKAERRTLTLDWTELKDGWPRDIKPRKRKSKESVVVKERHVFLGYRWGADLDKQINAIVKQTGVPGGEVVVFLLSYAIKKYQEGQLSLTPKTITVTNQVNPAWGA